MGIVGFLVSLMFTPGDTPIFTSHSDCNNYKTILCRFHRLSSVSSRVHNCISRKDHNVPSWHGIPFWNVCVPKILRIVNFQPSWLSVMTSLHIITTTFKHTYLSVDMLCPKIENAQWAAKTTITRFGIRATAATRNFMSQIFLNTYNAMWCLKKCHGAKFVSWL